VLTIPLLLLQYFFCAVNQVTTSSRQVYAFARDKGLPCHAFLSRVQPGTGVPANSVYVTLIFTCLIALIIIGSPPAFNIILSVSATGLFTSYIVVISAVLAKKLRGETFPPSRFNVGRKFGIFANVAALCFLSVAFVFLFFPAVPAPDAVSMNWAILIYGFVVCFALVYYYFYGRHHYEGPVQ
jgi:amino acid transporter